MGIAIVLAAPDGEILVLLLLIAGPWAMGWHMVWQMRQLKLDDQDRLLSLFRSNRDAGLLPVLFFAVALIV
jgi:4-hydroxybenzoate polyprenyltransferase